MTTPAPEWPSKEKINGVFDYWIEYTIDPQDKADTESMRRLCLSALEAREALETIAAWDKSTFPATNHYWDAEKTQPMSYSAAYGSNGERDFMRNLAEQALKGGRR